MARKVNPDHETKAETKAPGRALVIVESPAKAKTINKYLGANFEVKASMGHVRDLPEKGMGVDTEKDFEPTYEILASRKKLISELKAAAKGCSEVYLATDLDREGEAIAWHLSQALGLDLKKAKRVVFNEITKSAILNAFEHPRSINVAKVNAQQARRILDRLVGYKISPLLWKKVARGLSAGRVQSVAVKLIVDREREIAAFTPEEFWKLTGIFTTELLRSDALGEQWKHFLTGTDEEEPQDDGTDSATSTRAPTLSEKLEWMAENQAFRADLIEFKGKKFDTSESQIAVEAATALGLTGIELEVVANEGTNALRGIPARGPAAKLTRVVGHVAASGKRPAFSVRDLTTRQSLSRPSGPFSTSTLQQAASNQLGFGAQRTMRVAQQLYEGVEIANQGAVGLITYMRTDSQNISADAIAMVRGYIQSHLGERYLPDSPNFYASKEGAQEAHEAIRPTDVSLEPAQVRRSLTDEQFKLYELIWRRFVACQMAQAQWLITEALIEAKQQTQALGVFKATGRVLKFDGFLKITGQSFRSEEQLLPSLEKNQKVAPLDLTPTQHFSAPPPRYSEASLVKALEAEGIGRPSTYASIITTIQDRQYVESRDRRLFATDLGIKVTDKLVEGFPDLMDTQFTRKIESELDQVEEANKNWVDVVHDFYDPLERDLATAESRMTHARAEATPSNHLCPKCQAPMVYRLSKRGKRFLSCSTYPTCDGATNVDREGNPVQLEFSAFNCPTCGKPMIKRTGRFGPFYGCSGYPECKVLQQADRKTGDPLPPKPPAKPTGLTCPKCGKKEILIRSGKRGEFLSCGGYPKCRQTLPREKLEEFQALKAQGQWPPKDLAGAAGEKPVKEKKAKVSRVKKTKTAPTAEEG